MEYITVELTILNPIKIGNVTKVKLIVDTGSYYSIVSKDKLEEIGITPIGEALITLADGSKVKRKIGEVKFKYENCIGTSKVIFGENNDKEVLGLLSLGALGLNVDIINRRLKPVEVHILFSGHSRWHGIKHKKMAEDAKRGKIFSKLIREITVAAREGGGNPDTNPKLRKAIESARAVNMPMENVKKAIMRGTGEIPGETYEGMTYEGYGPGGIAIIVEVLTDNKNRTTAEVRKIFSQYGGTLAESGNVSWMFSQKGYISIEKSSIGEDEMTSLALELGVEDLKTDDEDVYELITSVEDFESVKQKLMNTNLKIVQAEITMIPKTYLKLTGKTAEQVLKLMDALEEHDDVKNVYANFDIPKEIMEKVETTA